MCQEENLGQTLSHLIFKPREILVVRLGSVSGEILLLEGKQTRFENKLQGER